MSRSIGSLVVVLSLVVPCNAQDQAARGRTPQSTTHIPNSTVGDNIQWGTAGTSTLAIPWSAWKTISSATTLQWTISGDMVCMLRTAGGVEGFVDAPVYLPTGAQIEAVEARICDTSASQGVDTYLVLNNTGGSNVSISLTGTTPAETPGCVNRTMILGSPIPVENSTTTYSFEAFLGAEDDTTTICDARIHYRLQVSPAPATATFADVPVGSPFHRFVEALAAAGLTAGCGGGNYCPNTPVTRGQIAVFMAAALGLHWPD